MAVSKKDALSIVFECAAKYQENFAGRSLLFVFSDKHKKVNCIEVTFDASNFQHLTGFITKYDHISPADFYKRCLNKRLSVNDFEFAADGTTPLKMRALPVLMKKDLSASMIGDYNRQQPKLYTEKIAGGIKACMGFVRSGETGRYVPNTVLEGDVRDKIQNTGRIIAAFRKGRSDEAYQEMVHIAKNVDWTSIVLPEEYAYLSLLVQEHEKR